MKKQNIIIALAALLTTLLVIPYTYALIGYGPIIGGVSKNTDYCKDGACSGDLFVGGNLNVSGALKNTATKIVATCDTPNGSIRADYVGDCLADDVEIQSAIDSLSLGGTVLLLEGTYDITATILLPSDITFSGIGRTTKLVLDDGVDDCLITNADYTFSSRHATGNKNLILRDLYIDGNKYGQGAGADATNTVLFSTVENLIVENLIVNNGWTSGIRTEFVTNGIISNNVVNNAGDDGIAVNSECYFVNVLNNVINGSGGGGKGYGGKSGIEIQDGSSYILVSGNHIDDISGSGIKVCAHEGRIGNKFVTVSDNFIRNVTWAIEISGPDEAGNETTETIVSGNNIQEGAIIVRNTTRGTSVIGNRIYGNGINYYGIRIYGAFPDTAGDVLIEGNSISGTTGRGVVTYATETMIIGNKFSNTTGSSVRLEPEADNSQVIYNSFSDDAGGVSDSSTNSTVIHAEYLYESADYLRDLELDRDLMLHLPFQQGFPTKDFTSNNNDAIEYNGVVYNFTGGINGGGAYDFDGDDDYIRVNDAVTLNHTDDEASYCFKFKSTGFTDADINWLFRDYNKFTFYGNTARMRLMVGSVNGEYFDTTTIDDGNWHSACGTKSIGGTFKLYYDGVLVETGTGAGTITTTDELYIGMDNNGDNNFQGTMDDIRIYDRELSAEEVKRIHYSRQIETVIKDLDMGGNLTVVGNIGIGTTAPQHQLHIQGNLMLNTSSIPSCDSSAESLIAYNWTTNRHVGCNSTAWNNLY